MEKVNSETTTSILVVDDEIIALKTMVRILSAEGYHVEGASSLPEALSLVSQRDYAVILTDMVLGSDSGLELMDFARKHDPNVVLIMITGYASIDSAIEATRKGAFHYLQKPIRPDEIRLVIKRAIEKIELSRRVRDLEQQLSATVPTIVGESKAIREIKRLITQLQHSDSTILITGESGTGKELVAQAIHKNSRRRDKLFIAINCGSLTDDLMANELFGHEKEAFTGASRRTPGLLESTDGGTLFLDEVADMPATLQAKILRVIQEKEFLRVGGTKPVSVDIRFLSATNKDLKKMVSAGIIREDLYYRLNVINLHLPSLADRREDIPILANWFLNRCRTSCGHTVLSFSKEALDILMNYSFPGNVRELENIVERTASLCLGDSIQVDDLPPYVTDFSTTRFTRSDGALRPLKEVELEYILWVLDKVDQNKSEASRILGIDRVSLYRILKRRSFDE